MTIIEYLLMDLVYLLDTYGCTMHYKFKNTKVVIRSCKLKKDRQYYDQKENDKRTNNDLQNTTLKTYNI